MIYKMVEYKFRGKKYGMLVKSGTNG